MAGARSRLRAPRGDAGRIHPPPGDRGAPRVGTPLAARCGRCARGSARPGCLESARCPEPQVSSPEVESPVAATGLGTRRRRRGGSREGSCGAPRVSVSAPAALRLQGSRRRRSRRVGAPRAPRPRPFPAQ